MVSNRELMKQLRNDRKEQKVKAYTAKQEEKYPEGRFIIERSWTSKVWDRFTKQNIVYDPPRQSFALHYGAGTMQYSGSIDIDSDVTVDLCVDNRLISRARKPTPAGNSRPIIGYKGKTLTTAYDSLDKLTKAAKKFNLHPELISAFIEEYNSFKETGMSRVARRRKNWNSEETYQPEGTLPMKEFD